MAVTLQKSDPIAYDVIVNGLTSVPNEMAIRVMRTATSNSLRHALEFSTALCDPNGVVISQGLTLPVHVGAWPMAMPRALAAVNEPWSPGDVVVFNDPTYGGLHLPDVFVMLPVFFEGEHIGFAAATGHLSEIGGRVPGGNAADSGTIFEEGLRIPPVKLFRAGELVEDVARLFRINVRTPDVLMADLAALRAACRAGESGLHDLCELWGLENVQRAMAEYVEYSARLFSTRLRNGLPDGSFEFTDYVELGNEPLPVHVRLTAREGRVSVDFTGSAPGVDTAVNCPFSYTQAAVVAALLGIFGRGVPLNGGVFDCIDVSAPPDTIVSWAEPRACAARGVTMYRAFEAVLGALAQAVPELAPAASDGGATIVNIAGEDRGVHFNLFEALMSAWGATVDADGVTGVSSPATNSRNTPVEVVEREYPLRVLRYEIVRGSGGAGRHRGGVGICREYEILAGRTTVVVRADRQVVRPWGLAGGGEGQAGAILVKRANESRRRRMPSKFVTSLSMGDRICVVTPGGGGYGGEGTK
jgi:N-methylhydantoinase B